MSAATRSIQVWTGYVTALGLGLLLLPNMILSVFGIAETDEVWIRTAGMLLLGYAAYYWIAVRHDLHSIFEMSVWVRWGVVVVLIVLAIATGPWQLVLFAVVDFAGALWTFLTLRQQPVAP